MLRIPTHCFVCHQQIPFYPGEARWKCFHDSRLNKRWLCGVQILQLTRRIAVYLPNNYRISSEIISPNITITNPDYHRIDVDCDWDLSHIDEETFLPLLEKLFLLS